MSEHPKNPPRRTNRRATSYDVAKLAGVSQSAVSRVFKSGASASESMRARVMAAAKEVGYRPNAIARGLITQRSNMIAVIITRMTNLNYPEVLVQLTQAFSEEGVRVLLFTIERESETSAVIEQLLQYQVDGVVTAAMLSTNDLDLLAGSQIPVVFFNRSPKDGSVSAVRCDQEQGERWLVNHLVEGGCRSFAIITGPPDSAVSVERTRSAMNKLRELGITNVTVAEGDYSYDSGRVGLTHVIEKLGKSPDAIIAANDVMAIGCIDEARDSYQLDIPRDLSVVGFDGVGPARYAAYSLTTVQQPVERMTQATVAMLLERINDDSISPEERVFAGLKITGNSARSPDTASPLTQLAH